MRQEDILKIFRDGQCIPAIPLVLDENRQFDEEGQRKLIQYYLQSGVGGIAIAVHTTQFSIRDPEHNLLEMVLQIAVDEIKSFEHAEKKQIIKVAGVVGETSQATQEAELSKKLGYDLVLLSTGGLIDKAEAYLVERTEQVSEIIPVIGFSMQVAVGGRIFSHDYWRRIAGIPGVQGIKVAPFDRYETVNIARAVALTEREDELVLYTGNDDNIIIDLLTPFRFFDNNGVEKRIHIKGGLLGQWSVWTEGAVRIFNELKAIRKEGKKEIPLELLTRAAWYTEANGAVFDPQNDFAGCIPGVHQALVNDGHMKNVLTLDPNETLSPRQAEEIKRTVRDYPILQDNPTEPFRLS